MNPRRAAAVLLLAAVAVAAWAGVRYAVTATDPATATAADRDTALAAATREVPAVYTIDYRRPDGDLDRWAAASTGDLFTDLAGDRDGQRDRAVRTRTVASAKVLHAALTAFDDRAGTARAVVVLRTVLSTAGGAPADRVRGVDVDLTRTAAGWRLGAVRGAG